MAELSSKATIKGFNHAMDRPMGWHAWDIACNDADTAAADTLLLPDRFPAGTLVFFGVYAPLTLSGATTMTASVRQVKIEKATGTITDLGQPLIGATIIDMKVASTGIIGTGTTTWTTMFNDSQINAGTHEGAFRMTVDAKTGTGTARWRLMVATVMGRLEY